METKSKTVSAMGWLASNWPDLNEATPAVIVNPEASPLDLMAWCWGEVRSLADTAASLSDIGDRLDISIHNATYYQRLPALEKVLAQAIELLMAQRERAMSSGDVPECREA